MPLTAHEEAAWDRLVEAACAAADTMSKDRSVALHRALGGRCRVEVLRAAAAVWIDSRGSTKWYRALDAAMEGMFRACTGAICPTIKLWGTSTGYSAGTVRRRQRGRPAKQMEQSHAQ